MAVLPVGTFPIDPNTTSGNELATKLNDWHAAFQSTQSSVARPSQITKGGIWAKTGSGNDVSLMIYDGVTDHELVQVKGGIVNIGFEANTKMLFKQSTAPTGWTKETTDDNSALRVVSGAVGTGGTVNFSTAFSAGSVGDTTLTADQVPAHTHTFSGTGNTSGAGGHNHTVNDPGHTHSGSTNSTGGHTHPVYGVDYSAGSQTGGLAIDDGGANSSKLVVPSGSRNLSGTGTTGNSGVHSHTMSLNNSATGLTIAANGDHTHGFSVSGSTNGFGGGRSHTHALALDVKYVDVIVCRKD